MKFTLEVSMNNDAFGDDPRYELARILRGLAVDFDPGGDLDASPGEEWSIFDSNGNNVGKWEITECTEPQFQHVEVQLTGEDGNIFFIMGRVASAMRRAGVPEEDIEAYRAKVRASESYDAALRATMRTVRVL